VSRTVGLAGLASAAFYALALAVTATTDTEHSPVVITIAFLAGTSWLVAGLIALARFPEYRTGWLMLAAGNLWALAALQLSGTSAVFTAGVAVGQLAFAPWIHLTMGFPEGFLRNRTDRVLVTTTYVALFVFPAISALFDPTPFSTCDDCPESRVIVGSPTMVGIGAVLGALVGVTLSAIYIVRLVHRHRDATRPQRRILGPVYVVSVGGLAAIIATNAAALVSAGAAMVAGVVTVALFGAVPIAFLVGLIRIHLARGSVAGFLASFDERGSLRDALAEALGDPSLAIVYPLENRWVDEEGRDADELLANLDLVLTPVESEGEVVAGLVHDASLTYDTSLLEGVAGAAALALRNQGFRAEAQAQYTFLRTLVETAPSLFIHIAPDGSIRNQNAAAVAAAGYDDEELVRGQHFWDVFISPEERDDVIARFEALAPEYGMGEYVNEFTNRKGERLVIFWRSAPVLNTVGEVTGIISGGVDITERRRRELELQRERDATTTALESIPSIVVVLGRDGRMRDRDLDNPRVGANRAFRQTVGWPDDKLVGRPFVDLLVEDHDGRAAAAILLAAAGTPSGEVESELRCASGSARSFLWTAVPVADVTGRTEGLVLVSGIDVTERNRLEREKEREREFLNAIANNAPSLLCLVDDEGTLTRLGANRAFEQTLEWDPNSIGGQVFWEEFVEPAESETVRRAVERVFDSGEANGLDSTWVTRTGRRLTVAWTCTPLPQIDERRIFLVTGVDITVRKQMEEEIRASRARIVSAADNARRRLERDLHDGAQQRLVALSVLLRLARSRLGEEDDDARQLLAQAGDELALALEELRELARGIHPAILTDRGLGPALEALVARTPVPVSLTVDAEPGLSAPVEAAAYFVVAEALTNVAKYAQASSVRVEVTVVDGALSVAVTDDGVGGADPERGSGLRGLADRVASLDGRLVVEPGPDGGTCVRARIPLSKPPVSVEFQS
jgi:PAS domain S-box-containing protein